MTGYAGRTLAGPVLPCDLLRAGLDADPDGLALISADTRWAWRTLDELSDRLAVSWLDLGLNPGDRVASLMPNRPALIVHYLACFKAGLVATPLNYRYTAPEIDHALAVSQARALLAHAEREKDLAASQLAVSAPSAVVFPNIRNAQHATAPLIPPARLAMFVAIHPGCIAFAVMGCPWRRRASVVSCVRAAVQSTGTAASAAWVGVEQASAATSSMSVRSV